MLLWDLCKRHILQFKINLTCLLSCRCQTEARYNFPAFLSAHDWGSLAGCWWIWAAYSPGRPEMAADSQYWDSLEMTDDFNHRAHIKYSTTICEERWRCSLRIHKPPKYTLPLVSSCFHSSTVEDGSPSTVREMSRFLMSTLTECHSPSLTP